jgi:predicted ATPase
VGEVGAAAPQITASGDTTNVAARLESLADPGTVLVGETTAQRLERRFVLEERGPTAVKGRARPVRTWRLVRARPQDRGGATTPLLGRDAELARLRAALDELERGRGQIVLVCGEDGLGKSRLVAEAAAETTGVLWLSGECPSYGGEQLHRPFMEILRTWLGVEDGEPEIAVRTKARARLGTLLGPRLDSVLPALAPLLGIKADADGSADVAEAYAEWLTAVTRERPAVVALDDLHWADPATATLASELFALTEREPVLFLFTLVPDAESPAWPLRMTVLGEYSHRATEIALARLDAAAGEELARLLLPGLDAGTTATLVGRSDGNPLYLEELLRAIVEGGAADRRRTWTVTVGSAELLPPALENLLLARIDRLPPDARKALQVAAIVGRTFPVSVVERAADVDVGSALPALLRSEIVREARRYPELECAFRHGLLQQAALSTLTTARRRELYGRVAAAFEAVYAPSLDEHLERLAHYYAQSDHVERARDYLERAAALAAPDQAALLRERAARLTPSER